MQDQGDKTQSGKTIDWDDFRFVLAIVRGGSVSAAAKQLGVDHATVIGVSTGWSGISPQNCLIGARPAIC